MKIGILTYMLSNYGAVLQCFALQKFIKDNTDCEVEVVDFTTDQHLKDDRILNYSIKNPIKRLVYNIFILFRYSELKKRKVRTRFFKKENISFTKRYEDADNLLNEPPYEDIYISGSDQVFNLNSKYFKVYYLAFEKKKVKK